MAITINQLPEVLARRVVECGDCLRWTGWCTMGHPSLKIDGKARLVRRWLYERLHGPIPAGRVIRCTCETPRCIAHLRASTYREIALECGAKGLMSGHARSARIAAVKRAGRQARITQADAVAIRCSDESSTVLARRYGISVSSVCRIRRGEFRRDFSSPFAGLVVSCAGRAST